MIWVTPFVGLGIFLLRQILRRCRIVWRASENGEAWALAIATAAITVALLVHSCFTHSLFLPYLMEPLWVLWGLMSVLARRAQAPLPLVAARPRPARVVALAETRGGAVA